MSQFAPNDSPHGSGLSSATQYVPNTGMHMGQFPWPQHTYIPCPGYASAHPYYPSSVPANEKNNAPPPYVPITPSSGIGAGVANHTIQVGQDGCYPPPVPDVSGANPPPQHPSAFPLYQIFPSISFPGLANPYAPSIPHKGYLGLPSPFVPQAQNLSVSQKRVAEDLQARDAKRIKTSSGRMKNDPLFKPVLNQYGQPNGTFMCSKDGMILHPESYLKHIKTKKHLGYKLERFKCPVCSRTYARLDACKRHFYDGKCGKSTARGAPPSFSASPAFTSSGPAAPAIAPTIASTYACPHPTFPTSIFQNMQIALPAGSVTQPCGTPAVVDPALCIPQASETGVIAEAAKDDGGDDDPDFWEANEIQDVYEI